MRGHAPATGIAFCALPLRLSRLQRLLDDTGNRHKTIIPHHHLMGKGKGSVSYWVCGIQKGEILYEMDEIPFSSAPIRPDNEDQNPDYQQGKHVSHAVLT